MNIKAVVFDLFGTLVQRTDKRNCYRNLFHLLDVDPTEGAIQAMTMDLNFRELAEHLHPGHGIDINELEEELQSDLAGIKLYPDVIETLETLKMQNIQVALLSNLAQPYALPALELIGSSFVETVFSFKIGLLKPDPRIFIATAQKLLLSAENIIMIGDTLKDDYLGSTAAGMHALLIDRSGIANSTQAKSIKTLMQVPEHLQKRTPTLAKMLYGKNS